MCDPVFRLLACVSAVSLCLRSMNRPQRSPQVTTAHDGGLGSTQPWFMRFGQSAEDGTMPLLQAMVGASVESGAYFEPKDTAKGPATAKKLGKWDLDGPSGEMLWAKSEDACGKWDLGSA